MAWLALLGALVPAVYLFRNRTQPGAKQMLGLCLVLAALPLDVLFLSGQPAVQYSFSTAGLIAPVYLLAVLAYLRVPVAENPLFLTMMYGYLLAVVIAPWLPGVWYLDYAVEQPQAALFHYYYTPGPGSWTMRLISYSITALASAMVVYHFCTTRSSSSYLLTFAFFPLLSGFFDLLAALVDFTPHYGISTVQIATTVSLFALSYTLLRRQMLEHRPVSRNLMMSQMREGVCVIADSGEIIDCNEAMATITNRTIKSFVGRQASHVLPEPMLLQLDALRSNESDVSDVEVRLAADQRVVSLSASRLSEAVGGPATLLSITDVTDRSMQLESVQALAGELKETNEYLSVLSTTDELTGLGNRRMLRDALAKRLRDAGSDGTALIMVDIDHFKAVNDTHGHAAGDAVLVCLAQTMRDTFRDNDVIARWGGEEFVALLGNFDETQLQVVAERLRLRISRLVIELDNDVALQVTASIGAMLVKPGQSAEGALQQLDRLLYTAKEEGRDRVKLRAHG